MTKATPALLAQARKHLFVAVVSDTLDALGHTQQAFAPGIRPLDDALTFLGRARTGMYREMFHVQPGNPYELEIKLIDDLKKGEVCVLACSGNPRIAPWGELLSTASMARGAAACVTDGLVRDIRAIRKMKFPVFAGGIGPLDSKGRGIVAEIDVPVELAGVRVLPGDLVFGDADGIVVIPQRIEAKVLTKALEKVLGEHKTLAALKKGEKLADVFKRYGVL
ncbi:MAG: RraA family protein [Alphaproteobacteria bacterium]|nr:RraA family protein [Alphaproteobacteria bacterium]